MKRLYVVIAVVAAFSMLLSACGPTATTAAPAPATQAPAPATQAPAPATAAPATAAPAQDLTGNLKIWSFSNDTRIIATAFMKRHPGVKIEFTMIPMTNGEYQTKVKAAAGTADSPDVVALEAAFVRSWVESDLLADQTALLPLAQQLQTYPAVTEVGTLNGVVKAYSYQATPGAFMYRRSMAKQCLGTDDLAQVQAMVSDTAKFLETAAKIKACQDGYYMVGTGQELLTPFLSNRAQPWIVNDALVIDPKVVDYIHFAKTMRDSGYESGATQWSEGWFAGMNDSLKSADGKALKVFSYFLPTWGLPYVLMAHAKSTDGTSDTTGDWAMISGPLPYQWGGTWIGALKNSPNAALATEFVKFSTLDEQFLTEWADGTYTNEYLKAIDPTIGDLNEPAGDFVSSQVVVKKLIPTFDNSTLSKFLGGENSYGAFAAAAPSVNGKLYTGSDDVIQNALNDPRDQYLSGKITEAQMWKLWLDAVANALPDLTIPEPPVK